MRMDWCLELLPALLLLPMLLSFYIFFNLVMLCPQLGSKDFVTKTDLLTLLNKPNLETLHCIKKTNSDVHTYFRLAYVNKSLIVEDDVEI